MIYPILPQEFLEFLAHKASHIISNNGLGQAKSREECSCEDAVEGVQMASIHLEWASITIKIFFPSNGPA